MRKKNFFLFVLVCLLLSQSVFSKENDAESNGEKLFNEGKKLFERGLKEAQFETVSNAIEFLRKAEAAGIECRFELGKALYFEDYLWNQQSQKIPPDKSSILLTHKNRTRTGVLLLHEFGSTPAEMKELGEFLYKNGFTVYVPRLAGHGTRIEDLKKVGPTEWRKDYMLGYKILELLSDKIYVVGSGWGGVLALELAAKESLQGVATLNTPLNIRGVGKYFLFLTQFSGLSTNWRYADDKQFFAYEKMPLRTVNQAYNISAYVKTLLSEINEPLVILQSENDPLVKASSAEIIYDGVKSKNKKIFWLKNAPHQLLSKQNPSNQLTIQELYRFVNRPD